MQYFVLRIELFHSLSSLFLSALVLPGSVN